MLAIRDGSAGNAGLPFRVSIAPGSIMWFLQVCLMRPMVKPERSVYCADRARWLINIDAIPKLSEELDSTMREQARNDFPGTYPCEI
jgi:hypothetical protein